MDRHRGPVAIQRFASALSLETAPDINALLPGGSYSGICDGLGPPMERGVRLAIRNSWGTQWILVPPAIAEQCRGLVGTEVTIRRHRNGRYEVTPRRDRTRCGAIHPRQIIVDPDEQIEEVERALCEEVEVL